MWSKVSLEQVEAPDIVRELVLLSSSCRWLTLLLLFVDRQAVRSKQQESEAQIVQLLAKCRELQDEIDVLRMTSRHSSFSELRRTEDFTQKKRTTERGRCRMVTL